MANDLRVQYLGGPCAEQIAYFPPDVLRGGSIACKGAVYYVRTNTANPVFLDYAAAAERAQEQDLPYDPRAVFFSFHALMRFLAYGLPAEMLRARRASVRLRRALR